VSAEILRQLALPATADALIAALDDADDEVRRSAARGLASLGRGDALLSLAGDPDPDVRVSVALARDDDALVELASDPDASVRRAVALAIAERGGPARALVSLLSDADASVRRAAADGLGRTSIAARDLEPLLGSDDTFVAGRAFDALAQMDDPPVRARLLTLARAASASAAPACERLRRLGSPSNDAGALVVSLVRERANRAASRAVHAAIALSGRSDADLVLESLASADRARRASAVELIEAIGGELVRPLLPLWEDALTEPDAQRDLEFLAESDPDELVRDAARRAIDGGKHMMAETLPTISLVERVLFLRKVSLFADLAPSDLKQIAGLARESQHVDGAVLGREGEAGEQLFVIASGVVKIVVGADRVVTRRSTGHVVGEMSIVADIPRTASLVCEGDVRVLAITRRDFSAILQDRPSVARAIIRVLSVRLAELTKAA
jgi:hypothetical protein